MIIRKYNHDIDWERICEIHDLARPGELEGSASKEAFIMILVGYIYIRIIKKKDMEGNYYSLL